MENVKSDRSATFASKSAIRKSVCERYELKARERASTEGFNSLKSGTRKMCGGG